MAKIKLFRGLSVFIAATGILIGLVAISNAIYPNQVEPTAPLKLISSDQASEAVKKFANVNDIKKVDIDESSPYHKRNPSYEVTLQDDRVYWVNAKTGEISGTMGKLDASPVPKNELPLANIAAFRRAEEYVKNKYKDFYELKLVDTFSGPNDSLTFTWKKIDENGAELRKRVQISIDLTTGDIGGYYAKNEETTISTKPQLTKEQAIENAKLKLLSTAEILDTFLKVVKDREGKEVLVWSVGFIERDDAGAIGKGYKSIDAITGEDISNKL